VEQPQGNSALLVVGASVSKPPPRDKEAEKQTQTRKGHSKKENMYNVALSKTLFQTGQEFIKALSGPPELSKLPVGITEHLFTLSAQAQACWLVYAEHSSKHYEHERIFGSAVRAITLATLGAEIISEYYWVIRMEFYQGQYSLMSDSHKAFAVSAKAMLRLMHSIADELNANPTPASEAESFAIIKKLQYALHITEIALNICRPKQYGNDSWHPETGAWLGLRARNLRNLSRVNIDAARFLEAQQQEFARSH
jgi:hypothetical protein